MTETAGEGNPLGSLNDEMELSAPFTAKSIPYMGWAVEEKIIEQKRVGWFCFLKFSGNEQKREGTKMRKVISPTQS